jgi:hypothetical protein
MPFSSPPPWSSLFRHSVLCAMTLACGLASARQVPEAEPQAGGAPAITVHGVKSPVDKSYAKILQGLEVFERLHQLAPNAALRYKLLPRNADTKMDGIEVKIVGDSVTIPVAVAADHTFSLERNEKALDEYASVTLNRKEGSMTWRAEVRTPGLASNARRLGDLRLECQVGFAAGLISNIGPILGPARELTSIVLGDPCGRANSPYVYFSDRPLFGVTLRDGKRLEVLSVDEMYANISYMPRTKLELSLCDCRALIDRTYRVPLGDASWSDDTLVEFEYMDDGVTLSAMQSAPMKTGGGHE